MECRKPCERCKATAWAGERFCGAHRFALLRKLARVGYLTPKVSVKWYDGPRPADERMRTLEEMGKVVRIF